MRLILVLIFFAVGSALAVVHMKYKTRMLLSDYQLVQQKLDLYEEQMAQLQLEQNTWSDRSRIEKVARGQLGMDFPPRGSVISIKP